MNTSKLLKQYKPLLIEDYIDKFWNENNIYEKVKQIRSNGPKFYFLDGPPYTSGYIHLGTAWNKVLKDLIIRFYTMKGYNVRRQPGWDMHGLPIEVLVEKKLGIKHKKEIEQLGVEKFIEECRKFAEKNLKVMTRQFKRLGVWMDWDKPYRTIEPKYMESEWWTFKKAWEKGLIEKDIRVIQWCPRCETALAEHEIEYKELVDPSIYVKFNLKDRKNEFILIWTTTPWTLPANMAVLVHPDYDYVKVKVNFNGKEEFWWLARGRLDSVMKESGIANYEVVEEAKGKDLDGWRYKQPFLEAYPRQKEFENKSKRVHTVVLGEFVTLGEGTGCVHIAPGHGEEDFEIGKRYDLPVYSPVGIDGSYTEGKWKGIFVKEADKAIIEFLREKGNLIFSGTVKHRYPTCWRCKTPVIFRTTEQLFLRVSKIKQKIIEENNKKVQWLPEWVSKRYIDGVNNVGDWVISRQRYWNTPIPIWVCKTCNHKLVIGSFEELKKFSKTKLPEKINPHRPWVDRIVLRCPKCGGDMKRISDVLDVWFDSAICSWASLDYPRRTELFEKLWPADFIVEGEDQILKWFYAQQVLSVVAFDTVPYKKVAMHGFVLDAAGSKMSKSLGNIVKPEDVVGKYGADTFRLYVLSTTSPWMDIKFNWNEVKDVKRALDILWNVFYMVETYMDLDKFSLDKVPEDLERKMGPEDKWILSRVDNLIEIVEREIERFHYAKASRALMNLIVEDLSRWYIKIIRKKFWIEGEDPSKLATYIALFKAFKKLLAVSAIFIPYISEYIYQVLIRPRDKNAPESVHMLEWPKVEYRDETLEKYMDIARDIFSAISAARQRANIKLRWPVKAVIIETEDRTVRDAVEHLMHILKDMLNTKDLRFGKVKRQLVLKPIISKLGPKFKRKAKKVKEELEKADPYRVKEALEKGRFELIIGDEKFEIAPEDVEILEQLPENFVESEIKHGKIVVDTEMTEEILSEAYTREIVRRVQEMRKQMDLHIEDKIHLYLVLPERIRKLIEDWLSYIQNETRAETITFNKVEGYIKDWEFDGIKIRIGIIKI